MHKEIKHENNILVKTYILGLQSVHKYFIKNNVTFSPRQVSACCKFKI
jgi:hypothetical protein